MSLTLTLIKEANVLSKLDASELAALTAIKTATGKETIAELVVESFTPARKDYTEWLKVVVDYAKDGGMKVNTKSLFADIAGAVLENDPKNPPVEMHAAIINKLWADYKASKSHATVMKLASAQEEEEFDTVDDLDAHNDHATHEDDSSKFYDPTGKFGAAEAPEDEVPGEGEVTCPDCGHKFVPEEDTDLEPEDEDKIIDDEDTGNRVSGAEELGRMGKGPDGGHVGDEDLAHEEEEHGRPRGPMTARAGEVVHNVAQNPKSILQQVLTAPREHMNAALKDIETDGASAWKASKLPENPHTKGSLAHRKWAAGFRKAMKSHLGLDAVPVVKPKRR